MRERESTIRIGVACVGAAVALGTEAVAAEWLPGRPNELAFSPVTARFVRVVIASADNGQPCIDELEILGPGGGTNLARAGTASASSCLPGHAIHQIAHLNDGLYGNDHSWIAAGADGEWAQIELPQPAAVAKVVFSRDRNGRFADRMPQALEVRVSPDGRAWTTVLRAGSSLTALKEDAGWDDLLRYAFLREQQSWSKIDPDDGALRVLKQFEAMIARMAARGLDVAAERAELAKLKAAVPPPGADEAVREAAYLAARMAKRRLFLRDPGLAPLERVLFVRRHPYEPSHNYSDILDPHWRPGGGVCVLEVPRRNGRVEPAEGRVTTLFDAGTGVARDPVADFDARTIHFAWRDGPEKYFHLFRVGADGRDLRQLTDGPFHDYYPCPLPDGGLGFISTRCRARFLCWRPQAFVLFRMEADGGGIRPLSHANLSEWAPTVMRDGRLLWTRSEYVDKGADFGHTLWAIRPDGTHPELVFGNDTPNCYVNAHEMPDTGELCCTLISHGGDLNGPIGLVEPARGRFNPSAVTNLTPDSPPHYNMNWARSNCYRDPVPLSRDLILCSHAPDRLFGLYVVDRWGNRELIHLDPRIGCMSPTLLRPEPRPPALASAQAGDEPQQGRFVLADIERGLAPAVKPGTVKYLRVCQEVRADLEAMPEGGYRRDHPSFQDWYATPIHKVSGPNGWPSYVAKASLGLVPVEADGSASFTAPAGRVIYFEALDGNLNEVQRMRSVVQLQPGEQRGCVGCHEPRESAAPVGRRIAETRPPRTPEPPPWGAVPFAYEQVVQPVWDAHCVRCHDAKHPRGLDLTGTLDASRVPASYRSLVSKGWVHYFDMTYRLRHTKAEPLTFGTVKSRLWQVLAAGHHGVKLARDDEHRVKCWIDLNCPLWPDYILRDLRPAVRAAAPAPVPAAPAPPAPTLAAPQVTAVSTAR